MPVVKESCSVELVASAVPDWALGLPVAEKRSRGQSEHCLELEEVRGDFQSYLHGFVETEDSLEEKSSGFPDRRFHQVAHPGLQTADAADRRGQTCAKLPHHHHGYFSRRIS